MDPHFSQRPETEIEKRDRQVTGGTVPNPAIFGDLTDRRIERIQKACAAGFYTPEKAARMIEAAEQERDYQANRIARERASASRVDEVGV